MTKSQDVIRIGFVSGFNSPYGVVVKNQFKGAQLAVKHINDSGGVGGKQVELIEKDDQMNVDLAVEKTRELIDDHDVHALVGTLSSATATAVNEVAKEAGLPFVVINQVSINEASQLGPHTFHECITPYITSQLVGRWGLEHLGKRWFFVVPDYQWGYESYESSQKIMQALGGEDLGVGKVPLGSPVEAFEALLPEILEKKPDVLAVTNFGSDQVNFIKAINKAGLKEEMSVILGISDITIIEDLPLEELTGMYWGVNFYWSLEDTLPTAKAFVDSFRDMHDGELPSGYAGYAYAGIMELLTAIRETNTEPVDPIAITQFLEGRSYDHYKGAQWWRPCDHQSFQDFYILRFKGPEESTHKYDVGEVIGTVNWDLDIARTCDELGHGERENGHFPK